MVPYATTVAYLSAGPTLTFKEELGNCTPRRRRSGGRSLSSRLVATATLSRSSQHLSNAAGALIVGVAPYLFDNRDKILAEAARHKIPTIYPHLRVADGGLMSYGANAEALLHQVGVDYVGRLLKGTKPADLPVQRRPSSSWSST